MTPRTLLRPRRTAGLALALALALAFAAAHDSGHDATASESSAASELAFAAAASPPLDRASRSRRTLRATVDLRVRDARLVRARRRGLALTGRLVGAGRVRMTAPRRQRVRTDAVSVARALRGLAGRSSIRARVAGRTLRLGGARVRSGRLRATVRARKLGPRTLGGLRLRGSITRRAHVRGRCVLVPFASCPRHTLPLVDALAADIRGIDLRRADLHRAYAHGAKLAGADLRQADLRGADLTGADLRRADLRGANLADAQLFGARLRGARLRGAFLCRTQMPGRRSRTRRDCGGHGQRRAPLGRRRLRALPPDAPARRGRPAVRRASSAAVRSPAPRTAAAPVRAEAAQTPGGLVQSGGTCIFYSDTADYDKDGLSDCYEATKRTLSIASAEDLIRDGKPHDVNGVLSSTTDRDSDDDGLTDGLEVALLSHPRRADSDLDDLADGDEYNAYGSNLLNADHDSDSLVQGGGQTQSRDPRLFDGAEVKAGMSPTDTDTDGDGFGDQVELVAGGGVQKPTVADLPQFSVDVDPTFSTIGVSIGIEKTTGTTTSKETSTTTLTSEEKTQSHEFSVEMGAEASQEFEAEVKVGFPEDEVTGKTTIGFKESVSAGTTNSWKDTESSEKEFGRIQSDETSTETKIDPFGCLQATLRIANPGNVGFKLRGIQVLPRIATPGDPTRAVAPLTTLQPVAGSPPFDATCQGTAATADISLPPGGSQTVSFQGPVDSEALLEYIAQPVPITFIMGKYEIVGPKDESYLGTLTDVNKKDAGVVIDFGENQNGPTGVHQFQVAANVRQQRTGDKLVPAGVPLGEVLGRLDVNGTPVAPGYGPRRGGADRNEKLVRLAGVSDQADPNDGLWTVVASEGVEGIGDDGVDFADIRLKPGQAIILRYLGDSDDDGFPDAAETINGTSDTKKDTDGDGLPDKTESQTGWTVPLANPIAKPTRKSYRVFSSPLSCDADGDGSPDGPGPGTEDQPCPRVAGKTPPVESTRAPATSNVALCKPSCGTDPKQADTNRDGITDANEPYPRVLQFVPPGSRAPVYAAQFGGRGNSGGEFNYPTNVAVDRFGSPKRIYVNDRTNRIIQSFSLERPPGKPPFERLGDIDPNGGRDGIAVSPLKTQAGTGKEEGQIVYAGKFKQEHEGSSRFVDFGVATFNGTTGALAPKSGTLARHKVRVSSLLPNELSADLAVDSNHNLYVASVGHARPGKGEVDYNRAVSSVIQYDPQTGRRTRNFGTTGLPLPADHSSSLNPTGIAVDAGANVFITPNSPALDDVAVRKFDSQSGNIAVSTAVADASGVGVDCYGYVYVSDRQADVIHKYSNDLTYLTSFGGRGTGDGRFQAPGDIDVDSRNNLYVVDRDNHRVQAFTYPFSEGPPSGVNQLLRGCEGEAAE